MVCTGGESGPGHVVWQAGIVLSRYCLAHPGMLELTLIVHKSHLCYIAVP